MALLTCPFNFTGYARTLYFVSHVSPNICGNEHILLPFLGHATTTEQRCGIAEDLYFH